MRIKNLIIAAVVMAVLIGGYFIVSALIKPDAPPPAPAGDMMIADDDPSKIKEIKYTLNGETIALKFDDILYKWQYRDEPSFPVKFEIPASMASAISKIKANRLVEETKENFAEYGLDNPYLDITAIFEDAERNYKIGDYNKMLDGYYFNIGGTDKVYIIPTGLNPFFEYSLLDLAEVDIPPVLDEDIYDSIEMTFAAEVLDGEKTGELETAFSNIVRGGLAVVGYISPGDSPEASLAVYGFDRGATVDIAYKEAQTVENTDNTGKTSSYTSTVHIDKTASFTVGTVEESGYFTCGSGLVYAADAEAVKTILSVLGIEY
ncbi:MAG: DUF4340 domain-containing protein [Clostridiales bacterium]|nr:DUF4340 domain-containing protein [Clostridiales bacterium]